MLQATLIPLNVFAKDWSILLLQATNNTECSCKRQWSILLLQSTLITLNVLAKDYGLFCCYRGLYNTECSCKRLVNYAATVNSNNIERTMVYFAAITLNVLAKDNGIFCCYR